MGTEVTDGGIQMGEESQAQAEMDTRFPRPAAGFLNYGNHVNTQLPSL